MNKSRGSEPRIGLGQVPDIAWPMVFRFRQRAFQLVLPLYLGCDVSTAIYLVCDQLYGAVNALKPSPIKFEDILCSFLNSDICRIRREVWFAAKKGLTTFMHMLLHFVELPFFYSKVNPRLPLAYAS